MTNIFKATPVITRDDEVNFTGLLGVVVDLKVDTG